MTNSLFDLSKIALLRALCQYTTGYQANILNKMRRQHGCHNLSTVEKIPWQPRNNGDLIYTPLNEALLHKQLP